MQTALSQTGENSLSSLAFDGDKNKISEGAFNMLINMFITNYNNSHPTSTCTADFIDYTSFCTYINKHNITSISDFDRIIYNYVIYKYFNFKTIYYEFGSPCCNYQKSNKYNNVPNAVETGRRLNFNIDSLITDIPYLATLVSHLAVIDIDNEAFKLKIINTWRKYIPQNNDKINEIEDSLTDISCTVVNTVSKGIHIYCLDKTFDEIYNDNTLIDYEIKCDNKVLSLPEYNIEIDIRHFCNSNIYIMLPGSEAEKEKIVKENNEEVMYTRRGKYVVGGDKIAEVTFDQALDLVLECLYENDEDAKNAKCKLTKLASHNDSAELSIDDLMKQLNEHVDEDAADKMFDSVIDPDVLDDEMAVDDYTHDVNELISIINSSPAAEEPYHTHGADSYVFILQNDIKAIKTEEERKQIIEALFDKNMITAKARDTLIKAARIDSADKEVTQKLIYSFRSIIYRIVKNKDILSLFKVHAHRNSDDVVLGMYDEDNKIAFDTLYEYKYLYDKYFKLYAWNNYGMDYTSAELDVDELIDLHEQVNTFKQQSKIDYAEMSIKKLLNNDKSECEALTKLYKLIQLRDVAEKKLLKAESIRMKHLKLNSLSSDTSFTFATFLKRCHFGFYKYNMDMFYEDVSRIAAYHVPSQQWFVNVGDKNTKLYQPMKDAVFTKEVTDAFTNCSKDVLSCIKDLKIRLQKTTIKFNEDADDTIKIFSGFAVKPMLDEKIYNDYNNDQLAEYFNFVKQTLCLNNDKKFNLLMDWLAYVFKYPGEKTEYSIIFRSDQGAGKNTFFEPLERIIGSDYSNSNMTLHDIADQFNSLLLGKMLIIVNEISDINNEKGNNGSKYEDKLKPIITDATVTIEPKGANRYIVENVCNMMMFTNHNHIVKMGLHERRYAYFDVSSCNLKKKELFTKLHNYFKDETFLRCLLTHFLIRKVDKDRFKCFDEETQETINEKARSLNPAQKCIIENMEYIKQHDNTLLRKNIIDYYTDNTSECRCYKNQKSFVDAVINPRFCEVVKNPFKDDNPFVFRYRVGGNNCLAVKILDNVLKEYELVYKTIKSNKEIEEEDKADAIDTSAVNTINQHAVDSDKDDLE